MISEIQRSYELQGVQDFELDHHRKGELPWGQYGCGVNIYTATFGRLPDGDLRETVKIFQQQNKRVYGLDAMGEGQVLRELEGIAGGVAITLTDLRSKEQLSFDKAHNIELQAKGITWLSTLFVLKEFLHREGIEGFDLIMCRPMQGWDSLGATKKMQYLVTQRLYEVLSPSGGILLIDYPGFRNNIIESWVLKLKSFGLNIYYDQIGSVEIRKKEDDPLRLPVID